jgi:hypothetical protein
MKVYFSFFTFFSHFKLVLEDVVHVVFVVRH